MLYRLYLSLLWLLIAFGVLVTSGVAIVQVHDHIVVAEDRACFVGVFAETMTAFAEIETGGGDC